MDQSFNTVSECAVRGEETRRKEREGEEKRGREEEDRRGKEWNGDWCLRLQMSFDETLRSEMVANQDKTIKRENENESCIEKQKEKEESKSMHDDYFITVPICLPDVPPMSMALRLRAFIMLTVMVLAVGL